MMKAFRYLTSNSSLLVATLALPLGMYYFMEAGNSVVATSMLFIEGMIMAMLIFRK